MLNGKTGIVFGVANKRSIAWAIAQALAGAGMRLAFTYQGERLKENVEELAATDGPIDATLPFAGKPRLYRTYTARGAGIEYTIDDGTIVPTAAASSIAFTPEESIAAIQAMHDRYGKGIYQQYGFLDAFNPSFTYDVKPQHGKVVPGVGWVDGDYLGIDQGPIVLMIENHRSDFVWSVMRRNPYIRKGLERAGFTGGWLEEGK